MFFRRILSVGVRVPLGGHDRADAERHLREVVVLDERDGGGLGGGRFGGHGGLRGGLRGGGLLLVFLVGLRRGRGGLRGGGGVRDGERFGDGGRQLEEPREERIARAHGLAFDEAVERGARVGLAHTHLREELGALLGHHARED